MTISYKNTLQTSTHKSVNSVLGKTAQFLVSYLQIGRWLWRCLHGAEMARVTASGNYSSERLATMQQINIPHSTDYTERSTILTLLRRPATGFHKSRK